MEKLEKVIRALNCCLSDAECDFGCPYWVEGENSEEPACDLMKADALELLKELDSKYRTAAELRTCYCPVCDKHFKVRSNDSAGNCPDCGHRVVLRVKEGE